MSILSLEKDAGRIFDAAVRAVQADRLIGGAALEEVGPRPLAAYEQGAVVGMGKAAMAMAGVAEQGMPHGMREGVVVVPEGYPAAFPSRLTAPQEVRVLEGGHPLPGTASARAGRRLLETAEGLGRGALLLVLISGGGTALASLPVEPVDVADLKTTYHLLLRAGVPIREANVVRKHLTRVGGGQLARAAAPADIGALAVSDVVGNDLSTIASGPTVPDSSTFEEAVRVLYRHGVWHDVPASVREYLADGARDRHRDTPSSDDPCFEGSRTSLVGTNDTALEAARDAAEGMGYEIQTVTPNVEGEARIVGRNHVSEMLSDSVDAPSCWLWGGEPTVTVTGEGKGGRNQEVALGAAQALDRRGRSAVLLSGGTDGIDGPTDAAGAWATPETASKARAAGFDPERHLDDNDAYPLFDALDQLLRPGPTHTNVMDVHVGLVHP